MELHIAANLRSLRKERGITQEEFAKVLGVTTSGKRNTKPMWPFSFPAAAS